MFYFSDGRKPLSITNALKPGTTSWISLPRGREQEAEEFGSAIAEYLNKK